MNDAQTALQGRVIAVFNKASGSCDASSQAKAREIFTGAGMHDVEIICAAGAEVAGRLEDVVQLADVLFVLGGDGRIGGAGHSAPSLLADAREAVRDGHIVEAAKRAVTAARRSSLDAKFGELTRSAEAVATICPLTSEDMDCDEPALEAVAVDPATAAGLFGLAFQAAFDGWRNDASVTRAKVASVDVRAHGEIPVILDGEKVRIDREVKVTFVPLAFRAIVPRVKDQ